MKRILILNYEFPPLGGGAGNANYYLLKELAKREDIAVDLVTSSFDTFKKEQFSPNVTIYYLDIGKRRNIHYQSNKDLLKYSWKAYQFSRQLKRKKSYDLVHAFFGIPCGYIAMKLNLPYVVSLRGSDVPFYNERFYWLDKLFFKNLSREIWRKAISVVANSHGLKLLALETKPDHEIGVIYNGVDIDEFKPCENSDFQDGTNGKFTIISTSRLIKRKGIEYLLEAFIRLCKKYADIKLILAGSGDLEADFKRRARMSCAKDKIEFLGSVAHQKMPSIYQKAQVFVLPSLNEGMSNCLLEAMASGLAVVATNTGGTRELVDDSNGSIIEKSSVQSIYNALEELYKDKNQLEKKKRSSREKAKQLSWRNMADKYLEIYGCGNK